MTSNSGNIVQFRLQLPHRESLPLIKQHKKCTKGGGKMFCTKLNVFPLKNVHFSWILILLFGSFFASIALVSGQCPWPRTPHYASLHSDCVCGYSNVRRLSVQCSPVGNFTQLLLLLHSPPVQRLPIDLLYINNVTGLNIMKRNIFFRLDIQQIHIANTRIDTIEHGAFAGQENNLFSLTLQATGLREVPTHEFKHLRSLRSLDLSQNRIHKVEAQTFSDLKQLATLRMAFNPDLQLDTDAFVGIEKSLKNLNLKSIGLKTVPDAIRGLSELAFLDLALNKIESIPPKHFENLDSLTALSLERNAIRTLQLGAFAGLNDSLSSLSLLNNQLVDFPQGALSQLAALRVLDLGFNNIHHIPENAFNSNTLLTLLALDGNPLTTVLESSFRHLNSTLRGISVGGKSFHCDCRIRWLAEWTRRYNLQISSRERNPQFCSKPNHLRNKSFSQIDFDDFVCEHPPSPQLPATMTRGHARPMPPLLQSVLNSHVLNSQHSKQVHTPQQQHPQQNQQTTPQYHQPNQQPPAKPPSSQMSHGSHSAPHSQASSTDHLLTQPQPIFNKTAVLFSSHSKRPSQSSHHQPHPHHPHHQQQHPSPNHAKPIITPTSSDLSQMSTTTVVTTTRDPLFEFVRQIDTIPIVQYDHKPTQAPVLPTTSSMPTPVFIPSKPRSVSLNLRTTTPVFHEITRLDNPAVTIANRPIRPIITQSKPKPPRRENVLQTGHSIVHSNIHQNIGPKQLSQLNNNHQLQPQPPKILIIKNNQPTTISVKPTPPILKPSPPSALPIDNSSIVPTLLPAVLKLTDVTYRNGTLSLKWQPIKHNRKLLGYQVLYRYFGSKKYYRSHWIAAKNTNYSVQEWIEPNEMIVVCVAMLEDFGPRSPSEDFDTQIPMSQCREVTTVESPSTTGLSSSATSSSSSEMIASPTLPSQSNQSITNGTVVSTTAVHDNNNSNVADEPSHDILLSLSALYPALKRLNEIDKIVIAISALVCLLIVIAIIVFSCCFYRSVSANTSLRTLRTPYFTAGKSRPADWETVSVYSTRSIPRARILQQQSCRDPSPPIPPPTITETVRSQYRAAVKNPQTPTNRYFGSTLPNRQSRAGFLEPVQAFGDNGYHYGYEHSQPSHHQVQKLQLQTRAESRARSHNKNGSSVGDLKNLSAITQLTDSSTSNSSAASSYNRLLPSNSSSNSYNSQQEYDSDSAQPQSIRPPTRLHFQGGTVNSTSTRMNDNELDIYIDQNYVKRFF